MEVKRNWVGTVLITVSFTLSFLNGGINSSFWEAKVKRKSQLQQANRYVGPEKYKYIHNKTIGVSVFHSKINIGKVNIKGKKVSNTEVENRVVAKNVKITGASFGKWGFAGEKNIGGTTLKAKKIRGKRVKVNTLIENVRIKRTLFDSD